MTEEEYFIKNFPDSCYYDKPLSPHWDYFQDGVEFGERESEKKIEDLEHKLEQTEKDLADYQFNYPTIKELQEENGRLLQRIKQLEKDVIENESDCSMCDFPKLKTNLEKQTEKAKEHIRTLISCLIDWVQEGDKDYCYITDAEQFLNEENE